MMKRAISLVLCLVMVIGLLPAVAMSDLFAVSAASAYESASGKVNNTTYIMGEGTDAESQVVTDWRSTSKSPTATMTPKYVAIHTTGTYISTSTALANHNYGKSASNAAWHYTTGPNVVYQCLADNRQGWHVGTSYTGAPANTNSIGIEMAVNNFPATETYGGEKWNDGTAIMNWWKNQFNQTMKTTAYLTVVLLKRHNLSKSAIKMHWDSKSYSNGAQGKDCPMALRATYNASTNTFKAAGTAKDGRDGYFWQMFMGYVDAYYAGKKTVDDDGTTTASKIGTYQIDSSDGLNVRSEASTSGTLLGTLQNGEVVKITEFASNGWGKVIMKDGTEGWCAINSYGKYIGIDAQAYEVESLSESLSYSYGADGALTLVNSSSSEQARFDMNLPIDIGTATTPYMSLQVAPKDGSGYYFGLTQRGSGFWMMRDCNSSDQLVVEESAPYMTGYETLEINISEWWKPTDGQRINQVRFYLAPNSTITIKYFYFAEKASSVIDERYNLAAASTNVTLMQPDTIAIGDPDKAGSYKYTNGMLVMTADTDAGFDVDFKINETFDVNKLTRLLVAVDGETSFDIILTVTHAGGTGNVGLCSDYCYDFTETFPADGYIPGPFNGSRGLSLLGYYTYNNIVPADGMSTITNVKVRLGSKGTTYINSIQIAENDRIMLFRDGIVKEGSNDPSQNKKVVFESDAYALDSGFAAGIGVGTSISDVLSNIRSDYTVEVYENGVKVEGATIAKTGQVIKVTNGDQELVSYQMAVLGDVDGDGSAGSKDARAIVQYTVSKEGLDDLQVQAADFDGSTVITTTDVRKILAALIG